MFNSLLLLLSPQTAWNRVAAGKAGYLSLILLVLLPMAAGSIWFEGYGLNKWGDQQGALDRQMTVKVERIERYQIAQAVSATVLFIGGAFLLQHLAHSFNFYPPFKESFTLSVYGWSPYLWARCLDAYPAAPTWACWLAGAVLSMRCLYLGVGLILKPDQTKGFGVFMMATFLGAMLSALGHFIAISILNGRLWK